MPDQQIFIDTTLDAYRRAQFAFADVLRRAQGDAVGALGLDPQECVHRVIASGPHWRLRDYGSHMRSDRPLLVIAAPIKRPYIWDLARGTSAIRHCLGQGLHVHLLEWRPASHDTSDFGLDEYVQAIAAAVATISETTGGKPVLAGHSLGGTLAAIYGAYAPQGAAGLVLLGAPLCFQPGSSRFRDGLVSLAPASLSAADPFPGSLLTFMSALASPSTFVWSRLVDAGLSFADKRAMEIHGRVERWALDEVPLPGRLVNQIIEWLYRDDRLLQGTLPILGTTVGPGQITMPTLLAVNTDDDVASPEAVRTFALAMPSAETRMIEHPGERGICLQHLAILVGHQAQRIVWPKIISWIKSLRQSAS